MYFDAAAFGRCVQDARNDRELTLRAAAEEIGVSFNTLYRAENGHNLTIGTISRIASWADVRLDSFMVP